MIYPLIKNVPSIVDPLFWLLSPISFRQTQFCFAVSWDSLQPCMDFYWCHWSSVRMLGIILQVRSTARHSSIFWSSSIRMSIMLQDICFLNKVLWYEYTHAHWAFEQDWQAQDIHHFMDVKVKKLATYTLHFQRFSLAALKLYNVLPYFNFIQEEAFHSEPFYYLDKSKPLLVYILSPVLLWNSNPWQYDYSLTWHLQINDLSEFIYVSKHLAKSDSCTKLIIWQCFISTK